MLEQAGDVFDRQRFHLWVIAHLNPMICGPINTRTATGFYKSLSKIEHIAGSVVRNAPIADHDSFQHMLDGPEPGGEIGGQFRFGFMGFAYVYTPDPAAILPRSTNIIGFTQVNAKEDELIVWSASREPIFSTAGPTATASRAAR